ncbi:MAG: hypothetical protein AAFP69_16210 [Planctomycetota bacterium]
MNGHESGFQMRHQPLQQGGFTRSVRPNNRQPAGAPAVIDPLAGRSIADVVDCPGETLRYERDSTRRSNGLF